MKALVVIFCLLLGGLFAKSSELPSKLREQTCEFVQQDFLQYGLSMDLTTCEVLSTEMTENQRIVYSTVWGDQRVKPGLGAGWHSCVSKFTNEQPVKHIVTYCQFEFN